MSEKLPPDKEYSEILKVTKNLASSLLGLENKADSNLITFINISLIVSETREFLMNP